GRLEIAAERLGGDVVGMRRVPGEAALLFGGGVKLLFARAHLARGAGGTRPERERGEPGAGFEHVATACSEIARHGVPPPDRSFRRFLFKPSGEDVCSSSRVGVGRNRPPRLRSPRELRRVWSPPKRGARRPQAVLRREHEGGAIRGSPLLRPT